jgi:hypothetical protein
VLHVAVTPAEARAARRRLRRYGRSSRWMAEKFLSPPVDGRSFIATRALGD